MKVFIFLCLSATASLFINSPMNRTTSPSITASFHEFKIAGLIEDQIKMSDFEGKYILCVNVASKCGYTKQYEPLQELYDTYQDKLVIIGFPCNQFGGQEPGTQEEIASF